MHGFYPPNAGAGAPMTWRAYPNGERAAAQPLRPGDSETPGRRGWAAAEISARRSRWCARGGCRCSVLLLTLERDTCRVCVVPVVLTAPLLVSFYSFLVCWRSAGGAQMVVVAVVLVERLMAREKWRQELRLRPQCK